MITYTKDKAGRVIAAHASNTLRLKRPVRVGRKPDPAKQTPLQRLESLFV